MNRIKGFAPGLGVATLIVAGLVALSGVYAAGDFDRRQDPTEAGAASDVPQAHHRPAPSGSAGENTPNFTHGSPPPPASSSPLPSLIFGDVNYAWSGAAELPSGERADFVIDGTEISMDDLERVGTTNEGNTAGIQEGLVVYRLKDDGTNDVYTFNPGEDHLNPEDGQIFKGQDVWTRWTTG